MNHAIVVVLLAGACVARPGADPPLVQISNGQIKAGLYHIQHAVAGEDRKQESLDGF